MMDFSRNHLTSFRMRCALTILILALAEFSVEAGSAKPMLVEVWSGGDDGLTLRLRLGTQLRTHSKHPLRSH